MGSLQAQYLLCVPEGGPAYAWLDLEEGFRKRWNVMQLWVEEPYRNLGIGTALMKLMLTHARQDGAEIWLAPTPMDGKADDLVRFYARLGFAEHAGYLVWFPVCTPVP